MIPNGGLKGLVVSLSVPRWTPHVLTRVHALKSLREFGSFRVRKNIRENAYSLENTICI